MRTGSAHPPGRGHDRRGSFVISSDIDGTVLVIAVRGRWDQRLSVDVHAGIRKCFADHPQALIVDLSELDDPTTSSAALWILARRTGADMTPPVQVAMCVPPETALVGRLDRLGAPRFLPVFADLPTAWRAVTSGVALTDRLNQQLPPEPESASEARLMVADACRAWYLPQLLHPGRLVMSELATNAIQHAGTDLVVTVSRRARGLHLAIRDGSPAMPRLRAEGPIVAGAALDERGQGLRLVDATAAAWGALPTHDGGGKVVWATVRARESLAG